MASKYAGSHLQDEVLRHSLENAHEFWAHQAEHLHWHKKPSETLRRTRRTLPALGVTHDSWEWFAGGEISTCHNCVDRHVAAGRGHHVAIYYDSPVTQTKETYTYRRLLDEVQVLAGALRAEGVGKGDVVMLYSECRAETCSHETWRRWTERILITCGSAHDPSGRGGHSGRQPPRRGSRGGFWRLCPQRLGPEN